MRKFKLCTFIVGTVMSAFTLTACNECDYGYNWMHDPDVTATVPKDYPTDDKATPNPEVEETTTEVPNPQTTIEEVEGIPVVRIDMTGIKNADDLSWLRLYGTGNVKQNVWVEVDGKAKGFVVYNNADETDTENIPLDIVFTIDNSGSMSEEADAIARDIQKWAQQLVSAGLDVRFGIVGYDGAINGAIDITTVANISNYLNYSSGTGRTMHFGGANATALQNNANTFPHPGYDSWNECGAEAIEFADKYFSFRSGANRIYVNFTDEPNQPNGIEGYSVKFFEDQKNWPAHKGTVHTVYSDYEFEYNNWNWEEQPWLISDYTGGTTLFVNSYFTGVTLSDLPVTGAMENSYIIRFGNIADLLDGEEHEIHITVIDKDGNVTADKIFKVIFDNATQDND